MCMWVFGSRYCWCDATLNQDNPVECPPRITSDLWFVCGRDEVSLSLYYTYKERRVERMRISKSLIGIWWRYDECTSVLFKVLLLLLFILFLDILLFVGCDSRLDHWLVFHHGLIKDGLRRPCIHPPDIQTSRRHGGTGEKRLPPLSSSMES